MDNQWHHLEPEQVLARLSSSPDGLLAGQVEFRRRQSGRNALPPAHSRSRWLVLADQFRSSLIYILLIAAVISFAVGEAQDGIIITALVLMNALIGFYQEAQAGSALQKLLRASPRFTHVLRDGQEYELPIDEVVVGEVVVLGTGDQVPADGRWLEVVNLKANESSMTGEALPVTKITTALPLATVIQDRKNMGWRGTTVVAGRGRLLVTAVGGQTRFGGLLANLQTIEHGRTPWQEKLQAFARRLAVVTVGIGLMLFVLGLFRQLPLAEVFLLAVSMIVSIIPEGLPLVMTIAMAAGITAMARRKVIVRKPVAVETLGSVTVAATDKTGTLTYGEMMVEQAWADGRQYRLTGQGYDPHGAIWQGDRKVISQEQPGLQFMLMLAALNNDARFSIDHDGHRLPVGDPTELALLVAADKAGWPKRDLDSAHRRLGEFPFEHQRKYMVTWHQDGPRVLVAVKGAPHEVMALCRRRWRPNGPTELSADERQDILRLYDQWAGQALRGLAVAYTHWPEPTVASHEQLAGNLILVGLVGLADALRPEAAEALQVMAGAGVRTIMLTGDHQNTGQAIARRLAMIDGAEPQLLLDGSELDRLSDRDLAARLAAVRVGTRLTPEHKLRIARIFKKSHQIVAMTGDGVNDVPALLEADVGVAVGWQSSDAAKEAADIILTDGNFMHLTAAIAEGRRTLRNIRRVMIYLVASNFGELLLISSALILGLPLPLLPKHIIWLNAVTDPFLGMALAREPQSPHVMQEQPHDRRQPLITRSNWQRVAVGATTTGLGSLAVFILATRMYSDPAAVFALTLTTTALSQWLMGLTLRSARESVVSNVGTNKTMSAALLIVILMQAAILYVPALSKMFGLAPLSLTGWLIAVAGALPIVLVEEIRKLWIRKRYQTA